jgi:hypothetical protein
MKFYLIYQIISRILNLLKYDDLTQINGNDKDVI